MAIAIAKAESGLNCKAKGDGHLQEGEFGASYGVFQIRHLPGRPKPHDLTDCEFNIRYAYEMYKTQGWNPWSVYKSKQYLKFYEN